MIALVVAALAGGGMYLLVTAPAGAGTPRSRQRIADAGRGWLQQSGIAEIRRRDLLATMIVLLCVGTTLTKALLGGWIPASVLGTIVGSMPIWVLAQRRRARHDAAHDAWPRVIEEIRMSTSSLGRSLPQALFEAARTAPVEMRPAFEAAHRDWLISTDFERTVGVLKEHLADATADAVCETLLIAHELGGSDVDRRLGDLAIDRRDDLRYRRDARARQAGVRFARRFVLLVPLGMALAGLSLGNGREAYASAAGQLAVVAATVMVAACWIWAGSLLRMPEDERVFEAR